MQAAHNCQQLVRANNVMLVIDTVIRSIFTLCVSIFILKRGRFTIMSTLMKFSFIGFIATWLLFAFYTIKSTYTGNFLNKFIGFASLIFMETHWLFTAHYLRVACLFKLLFSMHTKDNLDLIKRKDMCLKTTIIIISALIPCAICGYFMDSKVAFTVSDMLYCSFLWGIAVTNSYVML